jgi:hypothetical protein
MDGASWRAAAENSGLNETLRDEWRDRCLVFELEKDRAVRCGCNKLLSVGSNSTTVERGSNAGFDIAENDHFFFDLCDGETTSTTSPGENPEASSTIIQDATDLKRLTDKLACHMNKTLPYRLMVPDYSATSCGGPIPPCEDLETFRQIAGPDAGKERNCKWVIARNKCHRYGF